ncbi:MAG: DUF6941 family protein [Candidatus Nealsonbacteria bacterium]
MVRLNFSHLCEYASILENGTPVIIGIFSKMTASSLPVIRNNTSLILNFSMDDKDTHHLKVVIKSPSDKEIMPAFKRDIGPVKELDESFGFLVNIRNLKIEEEGTFNVEIIVDDKTLKKIPLTFNILKK